MDILELKNTLCESRIPLNPLNRAMFTAEYRIRKLKDRSIETKPKLREKKRTELSPRNIWNIVKRSNIILDSRKERREWSRSNIWTLNKTCIL